VGTFTSIFKDNISLTDLAPDPAFVFSSVTFKTPKIHHSSKIKSHKEVTVENKVFLTIFA
jgi:hypothetical protein